MSHSAPPDAILGVPFTPLASATARCANCDGVLLGHYCHECGAARADERPLAVRRFVHELVHEISSLDSTTVGSLRALVRQPGRLTAEYLAGRTRRFLSPLRLFLLAWAAFVLSTTLYARDGSIGAEVVAAQLGGDRAAAREAAAAAAADPLRPSAAQGERIGAAFGRYAMNPWLRLADPLMVGLLLALLYRGRRRGYAEHVVFALHLLAFNALLSAITTWLHHRAGWTGPGNEAISWFHWVALGGYFFIAARVVHAESRLRSAMKSVAFVAGSQLAVMIVPLVVVVAVVFLELAH
jgi:hypothetical protein